MDDGLAPLVHCLVHLLLLLQNLLAVTHGPLELVHRGVEAGVGPRCPLEPLGKPELLTVDLVLHRSDTA